ncbi:MAG: hypothetical protein RIS47_202 [Bacteroidota bacterium]|jgi:tetratricopeptide (TPR) repeat protein
MRNIHITKPLLWLLLFVSFQTIASDKIDSLKSALSIETTDSLKIQLYNRLSYVFYPDQPDSVIRYARLAQTLSDEIGYSVGLCSSYRMMGLGQFAKRNFEDASKTFLKALKLATSINSVVELGKIHILLGMVEEAQANYRTALEFDNKALQFIIASGNHRDLGSLYNNMGESYLGLKRYSLALDHFLMAYEQIKRHSYGAGDAVVLYNIGEAYFYLEEYDKAMIYLEEVKIKYSREASSELILGECYNLMGAVFLKRLDLKNAEDYLNKAMMLGLKMKNISLQVEVYERLIELAYIHNDTKLVFQNFQTYKTLHDSLNRLEQTRQVAEVNIKYQTQLKESEIMRLVQSKNNQLYISLAAIIILMLVGVISWQFVKQLQAKEELAQKTIEHYRIEQAQLKKEIETKFNEKEIVRVELEGAKHEHDKLMLHLKTASEEKRIVARQLEKKNLRILDLETRLEDKSAEYESEQIFFSLRNQLEKLVQDKNKATKAELKQVKELISKILLEQKNKELFKRLKETFPKLSNDDLRLCAYMRNHFSNSEVAEFLEVTQDTLYTRKHRLKRKLDLDKDIDIGEFLIEFEETKNYAAPTRSKNEPLNDTESDTENVLDPYAAMIDHGPEI